jgi:hypothetical protein
MHRKKKSHSFTPSRQGVIYATEYKCGCIMHPLAGRIRHCGALGARTLSGRFVKLETDIGKHAAGDVKETFPLAAIVR